MLAVAGGFIIVVSKAFSPTVVGWVTFGVALGILALVGLCQVDRARGTLQRGLDATTGALAIWTVIASVVFTGVTWLSFAEGIGFALLALIGLITHELTTERVVHSLSVERRRTSEPNEAAA